MTNQPRNEKGRFGRVGSEPKGEPIALRLPQSLDAEARAAAASEGVDIKEWVKDAIAKRLGKA